MLPQIREEVNINDIPILDPHYITKSVYVSKYKVKDGPNRIVFTRAKMSPLIMDGARMRTYPLTTNGKIPVYRIPLADFEREDLSKQEKLL